MLVSVSLFMFIVMLKTPYEVVLDLDNFIFGVYRYDVDLVMHASSPVHDTKRCVYLTLAGVNKNRFSNLL